MKIGAVILGLLGFCSALLPAIPFAVKFGVAALAPAGLLLYEYMECTSYECCNDR